MANIPHQHHPGDVASARKLYEKAHAAYLASYGADHEETLDAARKAAE
jgi:hypothetical protein